MSRYGNQEGAVRVQRIMKRSIGAGLLATTSAVAAVAMLATTTACAPTASSTRGTAQASAGAPASLSPAPGSTPARPATVQAAGLRVADTGSTTGRTVRRYRSGTPSGSECG